MESRLLLTNTVVAGQVDDAKAALMALFDPALAAGSAADSFQQGLNTSMTTFGQSLGTYTSSVQGLIDINQTITNIKSQPLNQTFQSLISDSMSDISLGDGGDIEFDDTNGPMGPITGAYQGWAYPLAGMLSLSTSVTTATSELHANFYTSPTSTTADLTYKLRTISDVLDFEGHSDSTGHWFTLTETHTTDDGFLKIVASQDTRLGSFSSYLKLNGGQEFADMEYDFGYEKMVNAMMPTSETWNFHLQKNIGNAGYFQFDTGKSTTGDFLRLACLEQVGDMAGGIVARKEGAVIAVGVIVANKTPANTFDASAQIFTASGLQSTQLSTGLTGTPLNLGHGTVTGVSFDTNFSHGQNFFLHSGAQVFQTNNSPNFNLEASGGYRW